MRPVVIAIVSFLFNFSFLSGNVSSMVTAGSFPFNFPVSTDHHSFINSDDHFSYALSGGIIGGPQTICYNAYASVVTNRAEAIGGSGYYSYSWQKSVDGTNWKSLSGSELTYETGQLVDKKLHKAASYNYLQSIDYVYNIRGWLTTINNPDNLPALQTGDPNIDLFGEKLLYNTSETGLNSAYPLQYNGNISAMVWNTTQKSKQGYGFTYDGLSRITLGDHKSYSSSWTNDNNYEEKSLRYDLNGNIKRLIRTNSSGSNSADYTYSYSYGNRLTNINSGTSYTYDPNGNTTLDGLRGVAITYNILNLPYTISKASDKIIYIYSAAGEKLAKKLANNQYQYYAGSMVYKNDKSLNYIIFEEGLVNKGAQTYVYEYHLRDHLGNTRVTFEPNGSSTATTQVAEYYPFGSSYIPVSPAGTNKYLYNGKELQDENLGGVNLSLYDYSARYYDPQIGRWTTVDPLAEKYSSLSPYNFVSNNPLIFIDPNGQSMTNFVDENDKLIKHVDDGSNAVFKKTGENRSQEYFKFDRYDETQYYETQRGKNEVNVQSVIDFTQDYTREKYTSEFQGINTDRNGNVIYEKNGKPSEKWKTYCNYATHCIAKSVSSALEQGGQGLNMSSFEGAWGSLSPNEMTTNLANFYAPVDLLKAQNAAKQGGFVFGGYEGHVFTLNKQGMINNIGHKGLKNNIWNPQYELPKTTTFYILYPGNK
jgi:RHS repeat-associated protein